MKWHNFSGEDAARVLKTDAQNGLKSTQAKERLDSYGRNVLREKKKQSIIICFLRQFTDFTVLLLLAAAAVSFIVSMLSGDGDLIDTVMILLIVVLNAVIGTIQESRAEKAIEALKKLSSPHVTVIRDGKRQKILSEELVRGDIVAFEAGDLVCADERLLEAVSVKAEESSLTGEAVPCEKRADIILPEGTAPADMSNMLFSSSFITSGHGKAVVVETGMDTHIGRIAEMLESSDRPKTPLQKSLAKTGKILGLSALGICIVIFVLGILQRTAPLDMFMISVSLAVAAIPEGLPAIVTIVLAIGVRKLAAKRAIVRKLPAVETLGSANVICSDKTGTLTRNKMTVQALSGINGRLAAHSSEGGFLLSAAALCNNCLSADCGDPTEAAIIAAAKEAGKIKSELDRKYLRVYEKPFDSSLKRMTTIHRLPSGGWRTIIKGAPDIIAALCDSVNSSGKIIPMNETLRKKILNENDQLAAQAMRVIGVAYKDSSERPPDAEPEQGLCFAGLIGMTDPPRPQAYAAVSQCKKAGIKTVMITGDHIITARAVAQKLGILQKGDKCASGAQLDAMSDAELRRDIFNYSVFARVSPEHKVRIVKAFRSRGAVVAMTGDGVNDAPALKCADIGCAMGMSGTDVAKNASDMILTDDNFATIVNAVEQGRGIFDNIRRTIHFLLSSNIGEILTVLCAFLMKLPSPLLAIQLLWINLVTDSLPALALGSEPAKEDVMERPPTDSKKGIFTKDNVRSIIVEGCFIGALAFLAFTIGRIFFDHGDEPLTGRTMTFAVLSISQIVHSFNLRSSRSLLRTGITGNPMLILAFVIGLIMQISVIQLPFLASIFKTVPLSPQCWLITAALSAVPLLVAETEKLLLNRESS